MIKMINFLCFFDIAFNLFERRVDAGEGGSRTARTRGYGCL
jgi:hypothetical protein